MPPLQADLTVPRGVYRGAWADGYGHRLQGGSKYANPYGDRIERAEADGKSAGWLWAFYNAWERGWLAADSVVGDSTIDNRRSW